MIYAAGRAGAPSGFIRLRPGYLEADEARSGIELGSSGSEVQLACIEASIDDSGTQVDGEIRLWNRMIE